MKIALVVDGCKVCSMEHTMQGKQLPAIARHYGVTGRDLVAATHPDGVSWAIYGSQCALEVDDD